MPLLDRVLVQPGKTAMGIFFLEATVIAVGPCAPDKEELIVPTSVKAGDRVLLAG